MSTITTASTMNDPAGETPGALVRLEHARHERRRFQMWLGLASFLAGALVILAVFMAVDWMWVVPVWVRALALPLLVGMGVFLLVRSRGGTPSRRRRSMPSSNSRSWASGCGRCFSMPIRPESRCRPRPGCCGHWCGRPTPIAAALDFRS